MTFTVNVHPHQPFRATIAGTTYVFFNASSIRPASLRTQFEIYAQEPGAVVKEPGDSIELDPPNWQTRNVTALLLTSGAITYPELYIEVSGKRALAPESSKLGDLQEYRT